MASNTVASVIFIFRIKKGQDPLSWDFGLLFCTLGHGVGIFQKRDISCFDFSAGVDSLLSLTRINKSIYFQLLRFSLSLWDVFRKNNHKFPLL